MKNVKFKLDINGLREIMKSEEMMSMCKANADSIAATANSMSGGAGYSSAVRRGSYTAIGTAFPASRESALDNGKNNTLLKARTSSGLPNSK